ncbi:MAG: SpoIIE family protein phosphatase [Pseudomonadota bacterium]
MTLPGRAQLVDALTASRLLGLILLASLTLFFIWRGLDTESSWRNAWWDAQQKILPRDRGDPAKAPAVVIAIDQSSMEQVLPWPWPRNYLAFLMEEIARYGATAVALDILLLDPDAQSPVQQAERYRARGLEDLADSLQGLGDTDTVMAEALGATPSIMPLLGEPGLPGADRTDTCAFKAPAVTLSDGVRLGSGYTEADVPLAAFTTAAQGLAAINFQATDDFIVRRVPAVQIICGKPILLLGAEALRVANGGFFTSVAPEGAGLRIALGDADDPATQTFPAERDGSFWLHYGPVNSVSIEDSLASGVVPELDRYIPAWQILQPDFDRTRLDGRIALVAVVDLGRIDERQSPLGEVIFGVEAHLQMIEMIRDGTFLRRFDWMSRVELAGLILGGLAIILFVPLASPLHAVIATAAGIVASFGVSLILFRTGLLIDIATPAIGWTGTAIGVIAVNLIERDRARLQSEIALQSERADRAFLQGELDAAARIQTALLPPRRFSKDGKVDLACYMDPARTIGGDFYDHMLIDDRHLFFLVADVSGKGADASQFMLLSKTLWKSIALRTGSALDRIQLDANSEITRENTAMMFVTGLVGILDLDTGELSYSSAGHDAPYLFADDKVPQQLDAFAGPPAGLVDGMDFPVGHVTLAPGDRLCIFTDGVTEAMDDDRDLYGLERLEAALGTAPPGLDSSALVDHVVGNVRTFAGAAEQSDDITLMVISFS